MEWNSRTFKDLWNEIQGPSRTCPVLSIPKVSFLGHNAFNSCSMTDAQTAATDKRHIQSFLVTTLYCTLSLLNCLRTALLASCLIYARPLWPDRWLVGARFVDSWRPFWVLVWVRSFIEPDFLETMYHSTIYHSNLSDQSALDIGLGLGLDSELHYFSIFHGEQGKWAPFLPRISRTVTSC